MIRTVRDSFSGLNTYCFGGFGGISIRDFGILEADWPTSFYGILGFAWGDLQGAAILAAQGEKLGLETYDLPPASFYQLLGDATTNSSGNSSEFAPTFRERSALLLAIDAATGGINSNAPIARKAPAVQASAYWRISIRDACETDWIAPTGQRIPSVYAAADQSFPSGNLYVGNAGPAFLVDGEPRSIASLTVVISNSANGDDANPDSSLGNMCSVMLAYYLPQIAPQPAAAPIASVESNESKRENKIGVLHRLFHKS